MMGISGHAFPHEILRRAADGFVRVWMVGRIVGDEFGRLFPKRYLSIGSEQTVCRSLNGIAVRVQNGPSILANHINHAIFERYDFVAVNFRFASLSWRQHSLQIIRG